MLANPKKTASGFIPGKKTVLFAGLLLVALAVVSNDAAAQNLSGDQKQLKNTLQAVGNFVSLIVLGIAVPNGAYGFMQYMTAGSNVDQDEKGRNRIRNTFIALAGVAVLQLGVRVFTTYVNFNASPNSTGSPIISAPIDVALGVTQYAGDVLLIATSLL